MIVRLIDKKGFTKLVQSDFGCRTICFPIPYNAKDVFTKDTIDLNETMETIEFRYHGSKDFDHNPIFEEVT